MMHAVYDSRHDLPRIDRCYVAHLESAIDGSSHDAHVAQTMHADRPLWVRYDLDAVARNVKREVLQQRAPTMWRYRELLPPPAEAEIITLGETMTPLLKCPRLGAHLGLKHLYIKDESRLPTGSFKARGMAMAVTMAKHFGVRALAAPTAGNAGGAMAAYAARAGLPCYVLMPSDTPIVNQLEAILHGARTYRVNGLINDCGRLVRQGFERMGWFDLSTLKEPYRLEGKKTMGLELAEQFGWSLPDVVLYPTGGGTGLIGMWKAFEELAALGWLEDDTNQSAAHRPRLFSCQSSGCAPIADAFARGERFAQAPAEPHTIASGLRVPVAVGDFMILDAVRASGGQACEADEDTIVPWMASVSAMEGIALCPEAAACVEVLAQAIERGDIDRDERIVLFNTGAAQKYIEAMQLIDVQVPTLEPGGEIDWEMFA